MSDAMKLLVIFSVVAMTAFTGIALGTGMVYEWWRRLFPHRCPGCRSTNLAWRCAAMGAETLVLDITCKDCHRELEVDYGAYGPTGRLLPDAIDKQADDEVKQILREATG